MYLRKVGSFSILFLCIFLYISPQSKDVTGRFMNFYIACFSVFPITFTIIQGGSTGVNSAA